MSGGALDIPSDRQFKTCSLVDRQFRTPCRFTRTVERQAKFHDFRSRPIIADLGYFCLADDQQVVVARLHYGRIINRLPFDGKALTRIVYRPIQMNLEQTITNSSLKNSMKCAERKRYFLLIGAAFVDAQAVVALAAVSQRSANIRMSGLARNQTFFRFICMHCFIVLTESIHIAFWMG